MNKSFWIEKGGGCLADGELSYDSSSRIESKRTHQWLMDGDEAEAVPNKKHIVEIPTHNSFSGLLNSNLSGWAGASNIPSATGQYTEPLLDQENEKNADYRSIPSFGPGNMIFGNKVIEDPFGINSSFGLSMSHTLEDPRAGLNYSGIRKVKISQVKESENSMSVSAGHAYNRGVVTAMPTPHSYGSMDENSVSMGLSFDNILPMGDSFNRVDTSFMSIAQPYNQGNDNTMGMIHPYMENNNIVSVTQSFSKDDDNFTAMSQAFNKENGNNISLSNTLKDNSSTISIDHSFSKGDESISCMGQTSSRDDGSTIHVGNSYCKVDEKKNFSMDDTFGKGNSNIISFGGFQDDDINSSGKLLCSYDLLMGQSSAERAEVLRDKGLVESNIDAIVSAANILSSASKAVPKKDDQKSSKKVPPNNFPSNVRSLLSTGMLDGVSVKYIAWSREKELCGTIRGSSYLCGCQTCNYSKAINAYEFERHAGCKTKHPNNHIYFENGKTVYGIVQELRNTPQNLLFEVIQTITGSPINQKSFRLWKESFLAATRELQRIYGNDGWKQLS